MASEQTWQPQLAAVGSLRAVRGVDVTTEIAGLVRDVAFNSGQEAKAGQILVRLNADAVRPKLLQRIAGGGSVVLVSDAGTPLGQRRRSP